MYTNQDLQLLLKKLIITFSVAYLVILFVFFFVGCGPAYDKPTGGGTTPGQRKIHGIAAIGAYIEEGASVQVRPASVDGVTPAELVEGTVDANGYYEIIVPEEIPIETETTEKTSALRSGSTTTTGNGFIVRAWSASAGSWIYSYAENDSADITANVNPYTDMFVRCYYNPSMTDQGKINTYFPTGKFTDGTVMTLPNSETVLRIMDVMSKMLHTVYGMDDIQNALLDTWEVDKGLDEMINSLGLGLNQFLYYEYFYLLQNPEIFNNAAAIADAGCNSITVDIWTAYGNTGNVTVSARNTDGVTQSAVMVKQSDSTASENHYKAIIGTWSYFQGTNVYISIDDYNSGLGNNVVVKKP